MMITLVEPNAYMTYQPVVPEVAGGEVEPRNVTVQLHRALRKVDLFRGRLQTLLRLLGVRLRPFGSLLR